MFKESHVRTQWLDNTFFPYCIREWNELHVSIRTATTLSQFKNKLIKCIRPPKSSTFKIDYILGIKIITRIRLGFSYRWSDELRTELLLYEDHTFNDRSNQFILQGTTSPGQLHSSSCQNASEQIILLLNPISTGLFWLV